MKIAELFEATPAGMENVNFREVIDRVRKTPEYQEMLKDWIDFSTDKQLANGTIILTSKNGVRTYGAYSSGEVRYLNASVSSKVTGTDEAKMETDLVKRYLLCFEVMKKKYASTKDKTYAYIKDLTNCTSLEQFEFDDNIETIKLENLKIKDLKGLKTNKVVSIELNKCTKLEDITSLPKVVNNFSMYHCDKVKSLHGIGKDYLTNVNGGGFFIIYSKGIASTILGLFRIKFRNSRSQLIHTVNRVMFKDQAASEIIFSQLQNKNASVLDAQEALIDAGFEEYAQL